MKPEEYLESNGFIPIAERRIRLKIQDDAICEEIQDMNLELYGLIKSAGVEQVEMMYGEDKYLLSIVEGHTGERIDRQALLDYGVDLVVIQQATIPSEPKKPTISVQKLKEKKS